MMIALLSAACAAPRTPSRSGSDQAPAAGSTPAAAKRVTVDILQEPGGWAPWETTTTAGGANQVAFLVRRSLTIEGDNGELQPDLAVSVPTLENGAWQVFPDGTMEQTWQINPKAKWHDGEPVTADDFVFGWELEVNPDLPRSVSSARLLISSATAPDPHTLVLTFRSSTPVAGEALFFPEPRHLLGDLLASGDTDRFINADYWSTGYVGTGPYRLTNWIPGASQEFTAFPDYVLGSPKIGTVIFRFLGDANTLMANLVSGAIDVALPDGLSVEAASELKNSWAAPGTGNEVVLFRDGRYYFMEFQHRADWAKPAAARDPRVRRAFYYTVDKEGVVTVETAGLGLTADSWIGPDDPRRSQFKDAIPEWTRDMSLAQRTLEDAGWRKGSDGILVNGSTGERLETEIRVTNGQGHVKAMAVMAEGWQQVGADVSQVAIPAALVSNQEYRSTFPFASLSGYPMRYFEWESWRMSCATASQADTRWNGHRDGYCNQTAEPLIQQLQTTLKDSDRTPIQVQIMRLSLKDDMYGAPLYWQVSPIAFAKGITGLGPLKLGKYGSPYSAASIYRWDKD
jgi:peptide/nickel transport system substrate-binding protein